MGDLASLLTRLALGDDEDEAREEEVVNQSEASSSSFRLVGRPLI